jgi:hypothetical protein
MQKLRLLGMMSLFIGMATVTGSAVSERAGNESI